MITANIVQKEPYEEYSVGNCDPANCSTSEKNKCDWNFYGIRDWEYGSENCFNICSDTVTCSKLDLSICPEIRGMVDIKWGEPPNVLCSYPLDVFQTVEDIEKYLTIEGKNKVYTEEIMPYFCSKSIKTCPENLNKNRFLSCSRFVSNGIDGDLCRKWITENPEISDRAIINYCQKNETEDCSCILENEPDVCNKLHCFNPSYLVSSNIKNKAKMCVLHDVIDDQKKNINKTSLWLIVILIIFFIVILLALIWLKYKIL